MNVVLVNLCPKALIVKKSWEDAGHKVVLTEGDRSMTSVSTSSFTPSTGPENAIKLINSAEESLGGMVDALVITEKSLPKRDKVYEGSLNYLSPEVLAFHYLVPEVMIRSKTQRAKPIFGIEIMVNSVKSLTPHKLYMDEYYRSNQLSISFTVLSFKYEGSSRFAAVRMTSPEDRESFENFNQSFAAFEKIPLSDTPFSLPEIPTLIPLLEIANGTKTPESQPDIEA